MSQLFNHNILDKEVQEYLQAHVKDDAFAISLSKSPFYGVSSAELATQIESRKKSKHKLPTWFAATNIIYPASLSIEQTSSEKTAAYKACLFSGHQLLDLTAGFGVDAFYFTKNFKTVIACEINPILSAISAHNAEELGVEQKMQFVPINGMEYLQNTNEQFDMIYVDPARRSTAGKVFKLADCTPNISELEEELLEKAPLVMIKTSPLLDISAGLTQLKHVAEIHIVSVKNECKELLWVLKKTHILPPKIIATTINEQNKTFSFILGEDNTLPQFARAQLEGYLYEPDVALLKTGNFNLIGEHYKLNKLANQTQLYHSESINNDFPGRIYKIDQILTTNELKNKKDWEGNVVVRNYPDKAENLVKKYKIRPSQNKFLIFTSLENGDNVIVRGTIIQHY